MPALANNRRELFVQLLVQGFTEVKAYQKAGYRRHDGNASTLTRHPDVQARIAEIRGEFAPEKTGLPVGTSVIAARAKVTPESLLDEAEQARAQAMKNAREGAAVSAIREKGVLAGVRIERSEIGAPGEFDHLSDDELKHLLIERLVQAAPELGISIGSIALNGNGADTDGS
jgi:phage terminase small subunit